MPSPTLTFAFILATLYGAVFHLILGGDARRLAFFLLSSWIGFGLGQMAGVTLQIDVFDIGALRVVSATLGAFVALIVATLLSARRAQRKRSVRG
ncbi:MAG TPA: hypothetical protein VHD90_23310 [Phototrophicaceae bacterium]|nr:hypothetical protein [Phototrophicaceae bacterium]